MTIFTLQKSNFAPAACPAIQFSFALAIPQRSESQAASHPGDQPLPTRIMIDVSAPERDLYRIALPTLRGGGALGEQAADVIRNDLRLGSLFNILNPRSFI